VTGPVAFRPPASASWASCPAGEFRPSCDRPARPQRAWTPTGFPRFTHARCDRGGRPSKPRGQRCSHAQMKRLWTPLAASSSGQALPLRPSSRRPELSLTRPHRRVHSRSPVRSSPCPVAPPDGTGALGRLPRAPHPQQARPARRTPGRGPIPNTDQELRTRHNRPPICAFTQHARPSCRTPPEELHPFNFGAWNLIVGVQVWGCPDIRRLAWRCGSSSAIFSRSAATASAGPTSAASRG